MDTKDESSVEGSSTDSLVLKLIYEDASESLNALRTNLYNINTNLALLIGFNATFATLLSKIHSTHKLQLDVPKVATSAEFYPYGQQLYRNVFSAINWLLLLKPIVALLLISSIAISVSALRPKPTGTIIYPSLMLDLSQDRSVEEFRTAVIENRDHVVREIESKANLKAKRLRAALFFLGCAAALLTINIAIEA